LSELNGGERMDLCRGACAAGGAAPANTIKADLVTSAGNDVGNLFNETISTEFNATISLVDQTNGIDIDTFDVVTKVGLSHPSELRMPLRWIAILRPQLGEGVGLAATSGVHSGTDAVKALLVGADVAMTASAVLRGGPEQVRVILDGLSGWMAERDYDSVSQMRGSATAASVADPTAYERANYMATLHSWSRPHDLATA